MIHIDRYAYRSKLKKTDPMQKLFFAVLTLGMCLWADSNVISAAVLVLMGGITVFRGGTSLYFLMKLLAIPMSFLLVGVLTVAVKISEDPGIMLVSLPMAGVWVGISQQGLRDAGRLFLKALGSVTCLYYLSLSTPLVDMLSAFKRIGVPKLMVEMMGLVYRFIFVLFETAETIFNSQNSRLGYASLNSGYRSLGGLASTLFIRAYRRSDELYTALEARGYDGELNVLEEPYQRHWAGYFAPLAVNIILIVITLFLRQYEGGRLG
ncbi:MAG: Cobalt ECF transporter, transmembrane component of energizing module CbiQ [Firmicutes bacterium]|nr:Cobalt ECF transporter, transmembrane component of energizing module CbiQ [Bacillota bacterium]MDI6707195.1 cobalt ECF transporter T component CbiQ [Bacillota bacterium]